MKYSVGQRVRVKGDEYFNGDTLIGKVGTIACFGYDACKRFDYGVRLDNPITEYVDDESATGFDEDELEPV